MQAQYQYQEQREQLELDLFPKPKPVVYYYELQGYGYEKYDPTLNARYSCYALNHPRLGRGIVHTSGVLSVERDVCDRVVSFETYNSIYVNKTNEPKFDV